MPVISPARLFTITTLSSGFWRVDRVKEVGRISANGVKDPVTESIPVRHTHRDFLDRLDGGVLTFHDSGIDLNGMRYHMAVSVINCIRMIYDDEGIDDFVFPFG